MIRLIHHDGKIEKLRWTDQHAASSHGLGVVLRGHGSEILDGVGFRAMAMGGAKITCPKSGYNRVVEQIGEPLPQRGLEALGLEEGLLEIQK